MEDLDIKEILGKLEAGYDIISANFFEEQEDYLAMGDAILDTNVMPDIDLPLTLKAYLKNLKGE